MGLICKCIAQQPLIVRRLLSIGVLTLSFLVIIVILHQKPSIIDKAMNKTINKTIDTLPRHATVHLPPTVETQNEVTFKNPWRLNEEMANRLRAKNTSKRLIWPEELPYGDRIMEQILYVPDTYKNETSKLKTILLYNGIENDWETPRLDQGEFLDCPVSRCSLTIDKSMAPNVDAIIFRHYYERPKHKREPNQIWIIYYTEAPYSTPVIPESDRDMFNWTAHYRMDSDIPNPYGYWYAYDEEEMKKRSPSEISIRNYAQGKTKQVAWFVSNCFANSNRLEYANDLSKYITVDIYGQCGPLKCPKSDSDACFKMLENSYKFYLAFENAHCSYYITEKLFMTSYYHDVIPIVLGPSKKDYELVAPKNSFIHVDDFESPQHLAAYLHKLDKNDNLYNEYFKWKGTGEVVLHITNAMFYCRLCAMLHDENHPPKNYADINEWWRGPGVCRH